MKATLINLRDNIHKNLDYLSQEYQLTHNILEDLENMINYNMSNSLIIQWYINNEYAINIINDLIDKVND